MAKLKKLLAVLLALTMAMSTVNLTVFAAGEEVSDGEEVEMVPFNVSLYYSYNMIRVPESEKYPDGKKTPFTISPAAGVTGPFG